MTPRFLRGSLLIVVAATALGCQVLLGIEEVTVADRPDAAVSDAKGDSTIPADSSEKGGAAGKGGTGGGGGKSAGGSGGTGGKGGSGGTGGTGTGGTGGTAGTGTGGTSSGGTSGTAGTAGYPSGVGLSCGPTLSSDCAARVSIPGGTYNMINDPSHPAKVDEFELDVYEVTVGRFRQFVQAYPGNMPKPGDGKVASNPTYPGWLDSYTAQMPASQEALSKALVTDPCAGPTYFPTWTPSPGTKEALPITCITFIEAYAFCIWDGGRLPSEAEWNFAAAGGDEQRYYPWPGTGISPDHAIYGVKKWNESHTVGSKSPTGDARWGNSDLAGSAWEWLLDGYADLSTTICDNCVQQDVTGGRLARGGSLFDNDATLRNTMRENGLAVDRRAYNLGMRCVHDTPN